MAMDALINFMAEATSSLAEVSFALQHGKLSQKLPSDSTTAYINLTTTENRQFCVKLDTSGFQVIGEAHDKTDVVHVETFETVYALMEHLSPSFTTQFAGRLSSKLEHLKSSSKEDNEN